MSAIIAEIIETVRDFLKERVIPKDVQDFNKKSQNVMALLLLLYGLSGIPPIVRVSEEHYHLPYAYESVTTSLLPEIPVAWSMLQRIIVIQVKPPERILMSKEVFYKIE